MNAERPQDNQNKKPLQVLKKLTGKHVYVKLKSDLAYSGQLDKIDMQMNLIILGAVEYERDREISNLGRVIIRGNNILYVNSLEPISQLESLL